MLETKAELLVFPSFILMVTLVFFYNLLYKT